MSKRTSAGAAAATSASASAASTPGSSAAASTSQPSKRPRHFHAGAQSRKQDKRDDDEEKTTVAPQTSPIRRLHRHALESILGFCTPIGLSRALQVCKEWNAAVRSMKSIGFGFDLNSSNAHFLSLLPSPLSRHLGGLHSDFGDEGELPWAISSAFMSQLAQRATELNELSCTCVLSPTPAALVFPSKLTVAELTLTTDNSIEQLHALFAALCQLALLEDLTLEFAGPVSSALNFALLHPASLRSLTVSSMSEVPMRLTDAQLDTFRSPPFSMLDRLRLFNLATDRLLYLLRTPHALRWQEFVVSRALNDAESAALATLAGTLSTIFVGNVSILPQLRCLTDLTLNTQHDPNAWIVTADTILAAVNCPLLTRLYLQVPLTSKDMATLLPRSPLLADLSLSCMHELESLSFLSRCTTLQRTLTSLMIICCRESKLIARELVHLFALRSLISLDLSNPCVKPLESFGFAVFTPPSLAFPSLVRFQYEHNSDRGEEGEDAEDDAEADEE